MRNDRIVPGLQGRKKAGVFLGKVFIGLCAVTFFCSACGQTEKSSSTGEESSSAQMEDDSTADTGSTEVIESIESVEDVASVSDAAAAILAKEQFTDRDKKGEFDTGDAVSITLKQDGTEASSDAVKVEGNTVTISEEGTYLLSGTLTDGMIIVDAGKTEKVQLVLKGAKIHSDTSAAIYVRQADKVFLTLAENSENVLSSGETYTAIDENNIDAVIFSKDDLTLNGSGTLSVTAAVGHGIVSKDDLKFTGGIYNITAVKHGAVANDSIRIADGTFQIQTEEKDGLHSEGYIYLHGGTFEVAAADDGMHADGDFLIDGGSLQITKSYEGLEGKTITIAGGEISLTSSDDGLNAAGGNDQSGVNGTDDWRGGWSESDEDAMITIAGGVLHVDAEGDGIDSNGYIYMTGGAAYVAGPTSRGNGAMDSGIEGVINGGIVIAAGTDDMAENFGENSTQGSILVSCGEQEAGSEIALLDSDGKNLLSWTAEKSYSSVVISTPDIVKGQTYTVKTGDASEEVTMDNIIYGEGSNFGHGGGGGGFGRGRRFR